MFDEAVSQFALKYAEQNAKDYQSLVDAVNSGKIKAITETDLKPLA